MKWDELVCMLQGFISGKFTFDQLSVERLKEYEAALQEMLSLVQLNIQNKEETNSKKTG